MKTHARYDFTGQQRELFAKLREQLPPLIDKLPLSPEERQALE